MKKHFLLLKQHEKTGLKYLCYHFGTKENCYTYTGSGKYWLDHIRKHGKKYIKTNILEVKETREDLVEHGIRFSNLFNVVNSTEFANLTIECCQTTAEPLQRPEVREKALETRQKRWKEYGLNDKELTGRLKGVQKMGTKKSREKAAASMKQTWNNPQKNKNLLLGVEKNKQRLAKKEYTEAELKNHKEISKRQLNKTMRERLNDPDWVHPNKGKSAKDIYGESYKGPWNKGKKWKGKHYNSKSFLITINDKEEIYCENEKQFFNITNLNQGTLKKLKMNGMYIVKKLKNSRHSFNNGDLIKLAYI